MTIKDLKDNNLILFECVSGSKAYGLDTAASDTDLKGVFYLPKDHFYGLSYIAQVNNETNDEVYYELGRFVELLIKNNPNILELLATPEAFVLHKDPLMDHLNIDQFLSKTCKETFAGYAATQIRKARGYKKKIVNPVDRERKTILDFCYILEGDSTITLNSWLQTHHLDQTDCGLSTLPHSRGIYALYSDARNKYSGIMTGPQSNEVSLSAIPAGTPVSAYLYFNKDGYAAYCKDYRAYWDWVEQRNEQRFSSNQQHGKDYDAKNMMHTIRLLQVAQDIFTTGKLTVRRNNRDELLAIKSGAYDYDELLVMADHLMERIETACLHSSLQVAVDYEAAQKTLITMRMALYQ